MNLLLFTDSYFPFLFFLFLSCPSRVFFRRLFFFSLYDKCFKGCFLSLSLSLSLFSTLLLFFSPYTCSYYYYYCRAHCHSVILSFFLASTSDYYVITSNSSYGDEMSSYQTMPIEKPYWSPVITAPNKNFTTARPALPVSSSPSSSSSARWDWLLFPPQYYSEFYTPPSTFVHYQKIDEEETDGLDWNLLASLPTCLLALLYLTPNLTQTSDDENENDQELSSLHRFNAHSSSSTTTTNIEKKQLKISSDTSHSFPNSNNNGQINRSSTPDTDDGYQSASDASRSDYSHQSSIPSNLCHSNDDITIHENSMPTPLMPRRISYAAALKPTAPPSFPSAAIGKTKQAMNHSFSSNIVSNDLSNSNGQKMKFIAPRFERMHHAKQNTSSNRTQIRTNNNNNHQRNHTVNPTRRR